MKSKKQLRTSLILALLIVSGLFSVISVSIPPPKAEAVYPSCTSPPNSAPFDPNGFSSGFASKPAVWTGTVFHAGLLNYCPSIVIVFLTTYTPGTIVKSIVDAHYGPMLFRGSFASGGWNMSEWYTVLTTDPYLTPSGTTFTMNQNSTVSASETQVWGIQPNAPFDPSPSLPSGCSTGTNTLVCKMTTWQSKTFFTKAPYSFGCLSVGLGKGCNNILLASETNICPNTISSSDSKLMYPWSIFPGWGAGACQNPSGSPLANYLMWAGNNHTETNTTTTIVGYNNPMIMMQDAVEPLGSVNLKGGITGLDCGNCLIATGKYYQFFANVSDAAIFGSNGRTNIGTVTFKFDDSVHPIVFHYDNATKSTTVDQGGEYIIIGPATVHSLNRSRIVSMNVTISVALRQAIVDASNRTLYLKATDVSGLSQGFDPVFTGFTIISQGGATTTILKGHAIKTLGTGPFGCDVYQGTPSGINSCSTNSTWFDLTHYQTQFAVTLSNNESQPNLFLWQDYGHSNGGSEVFTATNDWNITVTWYSWMNGTWVSLYHVKLSMETGNQGTVDEWTTLNVQWYNRNTLVKTDSLTAWMEQANIAGTATGQVRIFLDMWFSRDNASTLHGGSVIAYYTGVYNSGYLWWGSWAPAFGNQSASISFAKNLNPAGKVVSAQLLPCAKIGWNVTRAYTVGEMYKQEIFGFHITTHDFAIEKFGTVSPDQMGGVATPNFAVTQVPNLPSSGFLSPLFALLATIATAIWNVIAGALALIWAGLGSQFPWFTGFWNNVYGALASFFALFVQVVPIVEGGLAFVAGIFGFITLPLTIVGSAWNFIVTTYNSVFKGVDINLVIEIFLVWVFGISLLEAFATGDLPFIFNLVRSAWRIAYQIMWWTYEFARVIIDNIIGLIP